MAVKAKTVCQISIIVRDLDETLEHYAKTFGIPKPEPFRLPKPEKVPAYTDGESGDYSDCRMAVLSFGDLSLELVQPGGHDSPWKRWLEKHGPGVQHIGFLVDGKDKDEAFETLEGQGCGVYHAGFYPDLTYTFVDGFRAFGLDFNIKWNTDNRERIAHMLAHPEERLEKV